MYLSRLILNPRNRRVQRELAEPYEMHRSIMRAFPDDLARGAERVLFRVDEHPKFGAPALLVQSLTAPDWSWLGEEGARGYLLPVDEPNPAVRSFDLPLAPGQVLAFRLRANPTVKRHFPPTGDKRESGDHKRVGLYQAEEQVQWLERKAQTSGFRVLSVHVTREGTASGQIHQDDVTHRLNMLAVRFDGLLQVTDPERLAATVRQGIGSGKGLGFGLLSLARAPM